MWGENGPDAGLESALTQPALIPELSDAEGLESGRIAAAPVGHRDVPYGWDTFMENVLVSVCLYVCSFVLLFFVLLLLLLWLLLLLLLFRARSVLFFVEKHVLKDDIACGRRGRVLSQINRAVEFLLLGRLFLRRSILVFGFCRWANRWHWPFYPASLASVEPLSLSRVRPNIACQASPPPPPPPPLPPSLLCDWVNAT